MNCIEWVPSGKSWISQNGNLKITMRVKGVYNVLDINKTKTVAIDCDSFEQAVRVAQGYWLEQA